MSKQSSVSRRRDEEETKTMLVPPMRPLGVCVSLSGGEGFACKKPEGAGAPRGPREVERDAGREKREKARRERGVWAGERPPPLSSG